MPFLRASAMSKLHTQSNARDVRNCIFANNYFLEQSRKPKTRKDAATALVYPCFMEFNMAIVPRRIYVNRGNKLYSYILTSKNFGEENV
jgi:hypothetical protein